MLASALDSHPFITCHGEGNEPWLGLEWYEGNKVGRIRLFPRDTNRLAASANKWIIITRDVNDIRASVEKFTKVAYTHKLRDSGEGVKTRNLNLSLYSKQEMIEQNKALLEFASQVDSLVVSYEELTSGGKDISILPEGVVKRLCDFIGVDVAPLAVRTEKLNYAKPRPR